MLLFKRMLALDLNKGTNYKRKCTEVKDEGFTRKGETESAG